MSTPVDPDTPIGQVSDADKARLLYLKTKQDAINKNLATLKKRLGTTKDAKGKKRIQDQITTITSQRSDATKQYTSLQNQIYSQTGQYDKLLTGANRDAYLALNGLFANYGLGSLSGKIFDYVKNGYSSDTISLLLQDTDEYKKRFAANAARQAAGLPVLSPAEYLATEDSYRQIMRQSGLPLGFYDTNEDFTNFIAGGVSPTELQSRVDLATQATALANPAYKQALGQLGLGNGDLAAYFLDPNKALPFIQKAAATAAIGAEAIQRGLTFDQDFAGELATSGLTRDQAAAGYAQIGQQLGNLSNLGQIYGGGFSQRQAEESTFIGGGAADQQKNRIISNEKAQFSGSAGAGRGGLAQAGGAR